MRQLLIIIFLTVNISCFALNNKAPWGLTGHRVVGEIAYNHMTKKAKRNLEKLLGDEGLAMISTYADDKNLIKSIKILVIGIM